MQWWTMERSDLVRHVHGDLGTAAEGCVVSIGSFDGVHLGHQGIVQAMAELRDALELQMVVATFDPHPRAVLRGEAERKLTTLDERSRALVELGVDVFVAIPFTLELSRMEAEAFVKDVLLDTLRAKAVVLGHDHRFGRDRKGDAALLATLGASHGFVFREVGPIMVLDDVVSSSRIRSLLDAGHVSAAATLLGRFHAVSGLVVHGEGRGRTIGVPTANLVPQEVSKLLPGRGVYAVRVSLPGGGPLKAGMMNIGHRPTFEGKGLHLEVNVLDWSGDLYGREVRVEFVERVRDERKFDGVEALIRQLNDDRDRCRQLLSP
ncbi:MAG: bifunctional riboflavin kinase/FAD synthetase [Bacteroidetes bacterium]|nr:bifunctional riboflavin kinase/FAD synthetase [Bacteroidota bacterium]